MRYIICGATSENVPSNKCAQQRFKSAYTSTQSDQSLRCLHKETLHSWLSNTLPVKILIWLCECAGRSEYSVGALVRRYVFRRCDPFVFCCVLIGKDATVFTPNVRTTYLLTILLKFNPFMPNGLFYIHFSDRCISKNTGCLVCFYYSQFYKKKSCM